MTNLDLHPRSVLKLDALSEVTECWREIPVSCAAPRTQDRVRVWTADLARYPDTEATYKRLPPALQALVVERLREAEAEAMRTQLRALAHELRAPRWHPSTSKIAFPPEDRQPYPPRTFETALGTAHREAFDQLEAVIRDTAAQYIEDSLEQLDANGWKVQIDLEDDLGTGPTRTATSDDDGPVYVFGLGVGQSLDLDFLSFDATACDGPDRDFSAEFVCEGPLTEQDLDFLRLVETALARANAQAERAAIDALPRLVAADAGPNPPAHTSGAATRPTP